MEINRYLEIPYLWDGRDFDGADCYGLLVLWFRHEHGLDLFDPVNRPEDYRKAAEENALGRDVNHDWERIEPEDIRRHDIVLLRTGEDQTNPTHCGIILDKYRFLHLLEGPGCNISRLSLWRPFVFGFYRHKRLNEP